MNKYLNYIKQYNNKENLIILAAIFVLILFYGIMYRPQKKNLSRMKIQLEQTEKLSEKFKDINSYIDILQKKKAKTFEIIKDYRNNKALSNKAEQGFFEEVSKICKQSNIKVDRINPIGNNAGRQIWGVFFNADYNHVTRFLSQAENIFKVNQINITSARQTNAHKVDLSIYSMSISTVSKISNANITELSELVDEAVKQVETIKSESKTYAVSDNDPMVFVIKEKTKEKIKKEGPLPKISISGISWDAQNPMAIINGKLCKEGDMVADAEIVKIENKSVTFKWHSKTFTLKLIKKESIE